MKISLHEVNYTKNEILSITADLFESFLGAMFLDQGMEFAKQFIADNVFKYIDEEKIFFVDYKSRMKEYSDAHDVSIKYKVLKETGVPHDKTFIIALLIDGEEMGIGQGKNKKEAEQGAAKIALERLGAGV